MSTPVRGRIVRLEVPDPQGRNSKVRPAVIVSRDEKIHSAGVFQAVAITGEVDQGPADVQVELPWQAQGRTSTGLKKRCAAVCSWVISASVADIRGYVGVVPTARLNEILRILATRGHNLDSPPPDQRPALVEEMERILTTLRNNLDPPPSDPPPAE